MSMKFFTGLQDLLGLYEAGSTVSSPASPIPPTTSSMYTPIPPQSNSSANAVRKKVSEANKATNEQKIRNCSHNRVVRFPEDSNLVTGFHEAPTSIFHSGSFEETLNVVEIISEYHEACKRRQCPPNASIEKQIRYFHKNPTARQEILCLKGERVSHEQMEALEEVFKRVQFNIIDFEYTFLDDNSAISLGEMIEFYDSCVRLNLSFNKQIDFRGWSTIFKAVKNSSSLQILNLRYTTLTEKSIQSLCRTLRAVPTAALTCLHLENTQMSGKNLLILVCALKSNTGIRELYLGDNELQGTDGSHIHQLITSNSSIQLLDLRNNNLSNSGIRHISDALKNRATNKNSLLSAIVLWNNNITGESMDCLAEALKENTKIETLNIGNNKLGTDGIARLKQAIVSNSNLHRLGLQNTNIDCQGAIILAECIADNTTLVRVDIRDNPIALAGLLALHSAMKLNKSITLLNIDANCVKQGSDKVRQYQDEFEKYFKEIQIYCDRNKEEVMKKITVTFDDNEDEGLKDQKETITIKQEIKENQSENCNELKENNEILIEVSSHNSDSSNANIEEDEKPKENNNNNNNSRKSLSPKYLTKREKQHQRFTRSSSLTCSETVHDIHDRLKEMSGSSLSLDATTFNSAPLDSTSNLDSMKTIKKFSISSSNTQISLSEWGSLPAIPQTSPTTTPTVRKNRRFSVSPSSSVFDVTKSPPAVKSEFVGESIPETVSIHHLRPTSLAIGIPTTESVPTGPASAPVMISHMNDGRDVWPLPRNEKIGDTIIIENPKNYQKFIDYRLESLEEIDKSCRLVVNDLLNYVVYEEASKVERKASILMKNLFSQPYPVDLEKKFKEEGRRPERVRTPLTPSRILEIAEELEDESDELIIQQTVRQLVRDVLQNEKNELRSTLDRRRRHQISRNSPV